MNLNKYNICIILFFVGFLGFTQTPDYLLKGSNSSKDIQSKPIFVKDKKVNKIDRTSTNGFNKTNSQIANSTSSSQAGTTPAEFSVSLSGAATYNVPIATPPGIKDINPNVGLSFNSQAANGLAGWGWNVSGLSSITRVASNKFYDDFIDGVDFDSYDRFSLDGQRLILKSGTYGADGSEYQTEKYSNIKIKAFGVSSFGASFGPSYFLLIYPDGSRAWYGTEGSSRGKLEWAINKWQDPQGNSIVYNYTTTNNLKSIDKILFGSKVGFSAPIEIKFYYKNRKRPEVAYINDDTFKRSNILERIEVKGNGVLFRKYVLTHNETNFGYEQLTSIQEFNKSNESLNPILFTYNDVSIDPSPDIFSGTVYPGYNYQTDAILSGEFNGDSDLDFILYNKNTKNQIHLFNNIFEPGNNTEVGRTFNVAHFDDVIGSSLLNSQGKLLPQQGITFIKENINGSVSNVDFKNYYSGALGLYYQYTKTWNAPTYLYYNTPTSTTRKKIPRIYVSGDFNGDGLTDVLAIAKPYTNKYCYEYQCPTNILPPDCIDPLSLKTYKKNNSFENYTLYEKTIDKNNNEVNESYRPPYDDCGGGNNICYRCDTYTVNDNSVYFINLDRNLTSSFVNQTGSLEESLNENDQILAADFNGDGKTDIFHFKEGKVFIYELNSSNQLFLIHTEIDNLIKMNRPILLGDYNGDGKTDFLVPTDNWNSTWKFFLSSGTNFLRYTNHIDRLTYLEDFYEDSWYYNRPDPPLNAILQSRYVAQDFNGDGKTDILVHEIISSSDLSHNYSDTSGRLYINVFDEIDNKVNFQATANFGDRNNSGISRFGVPILLNGHSNNGNMEYAYISANHLTGYEFQTDHRQSMTLDQISNNGVTHEIDYYNLTTEGENYELIYTGDYDEIYPNVNLNIVPSFQLVDEIRQIGGGLTRTQNFKYTGAVSNINGLGFLGFKQIKKTNWNGYGVQQLWDITDYDPQKRGAAIQNWTSIGPSNSPNNFISKTNYTYQTTLNTDKIFINVATDINSTNSLTGVVKSKSILYDTYFNPLTITTTSPGGSSEVTYEYYNNVAPDNQWYAVGRLKNKIGNNILGTETFSTEQKFIYNNNLLNEVHKKGDGTPWLYENYQYDTFGNVIQKKLSGSGIADRIENFEFDSSGRFMLKSIDLEGMETTYANDKFTGNTLTTTNPYGLTSEYQYDGWQRVVKEINYLGKETNFIYSNSSIGGDGGFLKHTNYDQGQDEKVYFNAFGWAVRESILTLNNKWRNQDYEYDIEGNKLRVSEPYFSTGSASQWSQYAYDEYGRPISQQLHTGRIISTSYDGLSVTVDDGVKTVVKTSDAFGNIINVIDPGGTVDYTYYANGVLKSTEYDGYTTTVTIDGWGRKIALNDPSAGNYTYEYNILGEITKEVSPKGETNYVYDDFGKLTSKQIIGDLTDIDLQYTYNGASKLLTNISGTDLINNKTYNYIHHYDNYYRPFKIEEYTDLNIFKRTATYDDYGRVNSEVYDTQNLSSGVSNQVKVKNVYEAAGILKEIRDFNSNEILWNLNSENERGQVQSVSLGNGINKTRSYDNYGYLTNITDQKLELAPPGEPQPDAVIALKMDYSFNTQRGILNSRKNYAFSNWDENFIYDNLDRLTEVNGATSLTKTYDGRGRITNNSFIGDYNYSNTAIYQLSKIELNNQGDLFYQQNKLQQVTYNAFKKPIEIYQQDKGRVSFEYGPLMNRTHAYYGGLEEDKTLRQYQKHYSSIIPVEIVEDFSVGSTKIITYIGGDAYSAPIAHIKKEVIGPGEIDGYHYLHRDYLGSILAISDSETNIVEERQFGAWGEVDNFKSLIQNSKFGHNSLLSRGFTGHEHFFEVSLIHMNGRMYDAKLGRFLSPDNYVQAPFSTQSFNRYGYVWNNPLSFSDPSGEWIFAVAALVGAYIGGAQANGTYNPLKWDWKSGDTWAGMGGGALVGIASVVTGGAAVGSITGALSAVGLSGGIVGGAITGIVGGAVSGAVSGYFMAGLPGGNGDYIGGAINGFKYGAFFGGVFGGIGGGLLTPKGHNIWTGAKLRPTPVAVSEIKVQPIQVADDALTLDPKAPVSQQASKSLDINKATSVENSLEFKYVKGLDGSNQGVRNSSLSIVDSATNFDDLVRVAQDTYPKLAGKTQLHHITPKYLGGAKNGPLVPLDGAYHQMITNEFRALWGYGKGIPSANELQSIMKQVYSKYPLPPDYGF